MRRNAHAIVFHRDQAHTSGLQPHGDLGCARVQRIVQQLAHDGRRTLDDLARGDLTDQFVGKERNGAGRIGSGRFHLSAF